MGEKVCRACPQKHTSRRSWIDDGESPRKTLDSPFATFSKASNQRLSWVQEVPRHCLCFPPPANLPTTRTEGSTAYQIIGVDYAGPLRYRKSKGKEGKAYILLYACSLTRGVFLDLMPNLGMTECLYSLQRFIARRGRPERIYSDNGSTFTAAAKWIKMVRQDEKLQDYLSRNGITWQFNLSRTPWWGGQFERLVGLVKAALNKAIGSGQLQWKELESVLLSVETTLNDRPLGYVEEDIQTTLLTPNSLLFLQPNQLLGPYHHVRTCGRDISICRNAKPPFGAVGRRNIFEVFERDMLQRRKEVEVCLLSER